MAGHQVHRDLAQVAVQLPWETKTASDTAHGRRDQVVQVAVGGRRQLQGAEADVVPRSTHSHHMSSVSSAME